MDTINFNFLVPSQISSIPYFLIHQFSSIRDQRSTKYGFRIILRQIPSLLGLKLSFFYHFLWSLMYIVLSTNKKMGASVILKGQPI